jgi:hypothetical protein
MTRYTANRGSDIQFDFVWPSTDGPLDLDGFTLSYYEVDPVMAPYATVWTDDPSNGIVTVRIEWNELFVKSQYIIRLKIKAGDDDRTTNRIRIIYR